MTPRLPTLFLSAILGASGGVHAADLLDTCHAAQSNHAVFAAARAAQQAGQEKSSQGLSLLLPSINLNANTTFNNQDVQYQGPPLSGLNGSYSYNSNSYGVTVVQPLLRQQNWMAYGESELQTVQADEQFRIAQQDLIMRVAQAYFDVLIAQDTVELVDAQKSAISEQLEQAKRNFEVGSATVTDKLEAQARYDLTGAQEIAAQNNLDNARNALQQLINTAPGELSHLGSGFKLEPPQPSDIKQWLDTAQASNPQLAIAQAGADIADKEVSRNRGGHLPTVDLVANYTKNSMGGAMANDTTNKSVGVQLNMPLFEGGEVNSKLREAHANRERARQQLESTRRSVIQQTRQAYLGVVSGVAQVQALQQALASSQSVLDASKLGQQVGVRTNLDVLNAQQQLFSTRRDLYQAQYNYLLSELRLKQAVGTLDEKDLARVNLALH